MLEGLTVRILFSFADKLAQKILCIVWLAAIPGICLSGESFIFTQEFIVFLYT